MITNLDLLGRGAHDAGQLDGSIDLLDPAQSKYARSDKYLL
jgi:hypothetical protein